MLGSSVAPQRRRAATEEASETLREVAVARKSGVERDRREVIAAAKDGIEGMRKAFPQHIVVDRRTNHLAEDMAQMEGRQICDLREHCDVPLGGWRNRNRLLDALHGAPAAEKRRTSQGHAARAQRTQR